MSDIYCWIAVNEKMPEDRIRVIAADKLIVIGDCFFGYGSSPTRWSDALGERVTIDRWKERIWRFTLDESPCPIPTHWISFPHLLKEKLSENIDELNKKEDFHYMFDDIEDFQLVGPPDHISEITALKSYIREIGSMVGVDCWTGDTKDKIILSGVSSLIGEIKYLKEEYHYMFDDIEDFHNSTGYIVNESFKIGWSMARSKMPKDEHGNDLR